MSSEFAPKLLAKRGSWILLALSSAAFTVHVTLGEIDQRRRRGQTLSLLERVAREAERRFAEVGHFRTRDEIVRDAWSRPIQQVRSNALFSLRSAGPDGHFGNEDDVIVLSNADKIRQRITWARLRRLNKAIVTYNAAFQFSAPLVPDSAALMAQLAGKGLAEQSEQWTCDAWGLPFVADPAGMSPVVRVRSVRIGAPGR